MCCTVVFNHVLIDNGLGEDQCHHQTQMVDRRWYFLIQHLDLHSTAGGGEVLAGMMAGKQFKLQKPGVDDDDNKDLPGMRVGED